MKLVLVRHTRVEAAGLCYGWCDVPLAASFAEEAAGVRAALPWVPDVVWTSPAARCRVLANTLGAGRVVVEPRLRELHMGDWEGRRWEEFRGAESEAWALDPWNRRPPGGETAAELWARVGEFRREMRETGAERVAIVTHAGGIRAWRGLAENRGFAEMMREPVGFGAVTSGD